MMGQEKETLKAIQIKYIYSSVNISKFKFELLQFSSELPTLHSQKYYVSANFSGKNCLLVFCKLGDRYHTYIVDRKTLSYNKNKVDYNKVFLKTVDVRLDPSIYLGTIFDGTYIKNGNEEIFMINDVYHFMGRDYSLVPINVKMLTVAEYIKSSQKKSYGISELRLRVLTLYELDDIDKLIKNMPPKVRGLCFYPDISGTKKIFMFNDSHEQAPVEKRESEKSRLDDNKKIKYIPKRKQPVSAVLEMRNAGMTDIYKLFAIEKKLRDKKSVYVRRHMGIALVQSTEKSLWCRELMSKNDGILVRCVYDVSKEKWEPIAIESVKTLPTLVADIEKDMDLIEVTDCSD